VTGRSSASAAETDVAVWFEAANSKTCDVAQQIFVVRLYFVTLQAPSRNPIDGPARLGLVTSDCADNVIATRSGADVR